MEVLGIASSQWRTNNINGSRQPFSPQKHDGQQYHEPLSRYLHPASRIDITECHSCLSWLQKNEFLAWFLKISLWSNRCRTHTHTCLEQLFELLIWNVSFMQKQGRTPGTKWNDSNGLRSEMDWSSSGWRKPKIDIPVFGLAGCHFVQKLRKKDKWSRPWTTGDHNSAGTPDWPSLVSPSMVSVFVGRRLAMTLLPPAGKTYRENSKTESFHVQVLHLLRWFTHTRPAAAGHFGRRSEVTEICELHRECCYRIQRLLEFRNCHRPALHSQSLGWRLAAGLIDLQVCQCWMINTVCSKISQRSNPGPLNLLDECGVSLFVGLNKGIQEPGHLQDLDRDLHIRFNEIVGNWSGRRRLLRVFPGHRFCIIFKNWANGRGSEPRSPVIGELRAQPSVVQSVSPSVTEVFNDAIEEKFQRLWLGVAASIRLLHEDCFGAFPGWQGMFEHLERMQCPTRCRGGPWCVTLGNESGGICEGRGCGRGTGLWMRIRTGSR